MNLNLLSELDCKQGAVRAVRYNVDGNYCLTCGSDRTLKLWNPSKKTLLQTYSGHGNEVLDAQGSCDNSQIVSCGKDRSVLVWDVSSSKFARSLRGCHAAAINCVKYNEDSSVIVSGSVDGKVKLWDMKSKSYEPIQILSEAKDNVTSIAVSDHEIVSGSADAAVRHYDLRAGKIYEDIVGRKAVTSVCFTADSQCLLINSCQGDGIILIDKETGELLQEFHGNSHQTDYRIDSVLDQSDTHVLAGSEDGHVYVWSMTEGKVVRRLFHGQDKITVHSLSFHPNQEKLVTAARGTVYLWGLTEDETSVVTECNS